MFAKAARAEGIDGLVLEGPAAAAIAGRHAWLGGLIAAVDPAGGAGRFRLAGAELRARLLPVAVPAPALALLSAS